MYYAHLPSLDRYKANMNLLMRYYNSVELTASICSTLLRNFSRKLAVMTPSSL